MTIKNYKQIEKEIVEVEKQLKKLQYQRKHAHRRRLINCIHCDQRTQLGSLIYIQTHWYEEPHGCTGGDWWHEGEG